MRALWSDLRDGSVLGLATFPVAIVVAHAGLDSGLDAPTVLATSTLMASAAVQLILYQSVAFSGESGWIAWGLIAMVGLRLVLYSCELNQAIRSRPLWERFSTVFFLGDTAYLEFKRAALESQSDRRALARFRRISRTLWVYWQAGTVTGLVTGLTLPGLPKEAVNVLIFSCLALTVVTSARTKEGARTK